MAAEEKAAFYQWIMDNTEALKMFFAKSTWLFISIFAVSTRLAMDRFKGLRINPVQSVCAYIIGVFIGWLSYHASKALSIQSENMRIVIVGCCAISFDKISAALISIKWRNIIDNLIKAYDSTKKK